MCNGMPALSERGTVARHRLARSPGPRDPRIECHATQAPWGHRAQPQRAPPKARRRPARGRAVLDGNRAGEPVDLSLPGTEAVYHDGTWAFGPGFDEHESWSLAEASRQAAPGAMGRACPQRGACAAPRALARSDSRGYEPPGEHMPAPLPPNCTRDDRRSRCMRRAVVRPTPLATWSQACRHRPRPVG
jgi:hypothetical protein